MIVLPVTIGWLFAVLVVSSNNNKQARSIKSSSSLPPAAAAAAACFSSRTMVTIRHNDDDNNDTITSSSSSKTKKKDRVVSMNKLRIGDYVRIAATRTRTRTRTTGAVNDKDNHDDSFPYSRVYSFGHYSNHDKDDDSTAAAASQTTRDYEYLQLYTARGSTSRKPLEISRTHLIYIVRKEDNNDNDNDNDNTNESCSTSSSSSSSTADQVCAAAISTTPPPPIAKPVPAGTVRVGDLVVVVVDGTTTLTPVTTIGSITRTDGAYAPFTESGTLLVNNIVVSS